MILKGKSIAKSAVLVTLMMLSFKVVGFIKQAVVAYVFGATIETDTYFIAWGFIAGVSESIVKALLVSLVAIYTNLLVQKGKEEAYKLINGLIIILLPLLIIIASLIFIAAPAISLVLAPSYSGDTQTLLIRFIRILSPVIIFGCFELVFGAISDSYKNFFVPRLQSFIYSICIIVACFTISGILGVKSLIVAQYCSSVIFTVILIIFTKKYHKFFCVKFNDIPELKNILITAIPLFIGNSALQINQIVDKSITSGLGDGAVSALSYCHTLEQFITNIMIVNIGNVMFANFAEFVARREVDQVKNTLSKAINVLISLLAGISVVTIICAKDIVTIVYYRGGFGEEAVLLTSVALIGYTVSFVAVAVRDLTIKSLYAFKDTKCPMIASLISICVNIIFSLLLSKVIGILGVALATSISAIVGMIISAYSLKKYISDYRFTGHLFQFLRCLPGILALFLFCCIIQSFLPAGSLSKFLISSIVGLPCYILMCAVCKVDGIRGLLYAIKMKIRQS